MAMFPSTDAGLLAFSLNFSTLISASPESYQLSPEQAADYAAVHDAYAAALLNANPTIRNKPSVMTKNAARDVLKTSFKTLAAVIVNTPEVTVGQRVELGIPPRAKRTAIAAPEAAPGMSIVSVAAWTVRLRLFDTTSTRRGKPVGTSGISVFTFAGQDAPLNLSAWRFAGNFGRTKIEIEFDRNLPPGTQVWLTSLFFNGRKQASPMAQPITTYLQAGGVAMAA